MLSGLITAIITFVHQHYGIIVVLNILLGLGYKAYRHIKSKRRERATTLKPDHRPYVRRKMTAAHSKYRRRPRRSRRSRMRKKA